MLMNILVHKYLFYGVKFSALDHIDEHYSISTNAILPHLEHTILHPVPCSKFLPFICGGIQPYKETQHSTFCIDDL